MYRVIGIGVDIVLKSRFQQILNKPIAQRFMTKMLHKKQKQELSNKLISQKVNYLCERWAVKQALVKATSQTGLVFSGIQIRPNNNIKLSPENIQLLRLKDTKYKFDIEINQVQQHITAEVIYRRQ